MTNNPNNNPLNGDLLAATEVAYNWFYQENSEFPENDDPIQRKLGEALANHNPARLEQVREVLQSVYKIKEKYNALPPEVEASINNLDPETKDWALRVGKYGDKKGPVA